MIDVKPHISVMMEEVLQGLAIKSNGIYVDATFGRGGHSHAILQRLNADGHLLAMDKDPEAVAVASDMPFRDPRFCIVHDSFIGLTKAVQDRGWGNQVDGILLDLGVSSPQLDDAARGFSFMKDGPLDMRMNPTCGVDAGTWVNTASADDIRRVLREYGEERYARRISEAIVETREATPFTRTSQLSELIARVVPKHEHHKHPATRSFQAIRIYINRELEELRDCLKQCLDVLAVGGRLCVMSFHSLEDRIVKQFIQRESKGQDYPRDLPIRDAAITRRFRKVGALIRPTQEEMDHNPRARSARLRIAEKLA